MKILNMTMRKEYEVKGEKKTAWLPIGVSRITDDGKQYAELNMFPGQTIYFFEPKPRNQEESF